ncbi:uncharacterized protein DS421_5g152180 [Arachis hypogaea]|nr:uncharacterized protein DS421_5g152180 [Arachis hypogaea]
MLAALVERWRPETHTFVLSIGEVTVTLEDVAHIFGLPIDGELVNGWTDSSSKFVQSQGIAIFGRELSVSHNAKSYIMLGWVRRIRDAEPLHTEESIRRYVRCQIFCLLGSTLFTDKSNAYAHVKYLPLLCDFNRIHTYSWGSTCLAHFYRALCRASQYDTKEMDGPLNMLFVWAWERMPCLAPVPRQTLPPAEIPVARRWSHSERTTAWSSKTFEWRPYDRLVLPDELQPHLEVCDIVAPLLSFECVEWHPMDRVMCQFGYVQPPLRAPRDIPLDQHCIVLRGVQLHDWTVLHGPWIAEWANKRHSRMRDQHPLPTWDFLPTVEYQDWYVRSYAHLLRLTGYVPHHPQPPAPQPPPPHPPQHAVFEPFPCYIRQPPAYSHDFSGIPSSSLLADPHRASVDMAHGLRGRTSSHTSESASCDSGFIQRQRAYAVVDTFNPGPSALAEAGGSAAPTDAGGSGASGVDDSVRGHPYDLRTEQNQPDRYFLAEIEGPEQNSDRRLTKDC